MRATASRGYWIDSDAGVRDFYIRVGPDDFAHMHRHVAYELVPKTTTGDYVWKVKVGVTVTRP